MSPMLLFKSLADTIIEPASCSAVRVCFSADSHPTIQSHRTIVLFMMATGAAAEASCLKNPLGAALVMMAQLSSNSGGGNVEASLPTIVVASFIAWGLTYRQMYFPAIHQHERAPHPDLLPTQ